MSSTKYRQIVWTPEMISRFWDWQSQYPENYFTYNFGDEIARSLRPFLSGRDKILDFGCGTGYLLPHLCTRASKVYACDTSPASVSRTNELVIGTKSFQGAYLTSELRRQGARFDAIVVVEVIEHLYDDGLDAIMQDIDALLALGGIVLFTTPNNEDLEKSMLLCPATGEVYHRWQHVRSWDANSLAQWLRRKGFEPLEIFATNFAVRGGRSPTSMLKRLAKRVLFGDPGTPHLVGVAKRA